MGRRAAFGPDYDQRPIDRPCRIAHTLGINASGIAAPGSAEQNRIDSGSGDLRIDQPGALRNRRTTDADEVVDGTKLARRVRRPARSERSRSGRDGNHPYSVMWEVGRFAIMSVLMLLIVTLVLGRLSRRIGMQEAIADAKRAVFIVGTSVMEPALTEERVNALHSPDSTVRAAAIEDLHRVSQQARRSGGMIRIKLWGSDGKLLYADDERLLAATDIELGEDAMDVLRHGGIEAEPTSLDKTENQFERSEGKLLEVYLPIQTESGERVLFEGCLPYSRVITSGRRILLQFAPGVLGGLVALTLTGTLLVASVARRLRRATLQRELLLRHAIEASDTERRVLAADLHDGVVQDLTGVSLTLAAARMRAEQQPDAPTTGAVQQTIAAAEVQIRDVVHSLRSLIIEIYPPNLREEGLGAAIESLCARLHNRGVTTSMTTEGLDVPLPEDVSRLTYRVAQEAVRNIVSHADASHVDLHISVSPEHLEFVIEDDGFGFDPEVVAERAVAGHVGLRGLGDLVGGRHGSLRLRSAPTQGTRIHLQLPLDDMTGPPQQLIRQLASRRMNSMHDERSI